MFMCMDYFLHIPAVFRVTAGSRCCRTSLRVSVRLRGEVVNKWRGRVDALGE